MMDKGFSLIETIIALFILSILLVFALPNFFKLIEHYQFKNTVLLLEHDLRFAKSTANQKKLRVSMCIAHSSTKCVTDNSRDWHKGWLLFLDPDNDFTPKPGSILRYRPPINTQIIIISSQNIQHGIQFNIGRKSGRGLGTGLPNGHFIICRPNGLGQQIILNIYGRLRQETLASPC